MPDDGFDFDACGVRHLTPQQWTALRRSIIARATEERKRAIGETAARAGWLCRALFVPASGISGALRRAWRRLRQHQRRLRDLRELSQMDDLALKDIGISRLDIGAMRLNANHAAPGRDMPAARGH
jgi:uncharacterized protein YjiS (DUF1127 family)